MQLQHGDEREREWGKERGSVARGDVASLVCSLKLAASVSVRTS